MIRKLQTRGFNWVDSSEFTPDKIDSYVNCDNKVCLLEVDFRYPKELHDLRKNIIFMCEKMKINGAGCARATGLGNLVPNLNDKKNDFHIKALKKI